MSKKIRYILIGLLILLCLVSPFFIKVKIECKSQLGECSKEVNGKLQMINAKYLFSAKNQASKILKNDFLVSNYSMQLKLPNILLVNTIIKKPVYSIFDKSQNKYFLVDAFGVFLTSSDNSNLPNLIKDMVNVKSGEKISDNDLFALKLIQGVNQMYQVRGGTIQNDTLVVDIPNGLRVILPLEGDIQILLGSLRLIYTKVTTDNPMIYSQIDMRFKNPVIR